MDVRAFRKPFPPVALALVLLAVGCLTGCSTSRQGNFAAGGPPFQPERFFDGRTRAWGVIEDRFGKVQRQFVNETRGRREGSTLFLDQRLTFSDGKTQDRSWKIRRIDAHRYEGTGTDVVGIARGEVRGNALRWEYTLNVPLGSGATGVQFVQWMLLQPDDVVINRVVFKKFGVRLGTVSEFFVKQRGLPPRQNRPSLDKRM